jgi:hypothetical protein
MSSEKSDRAKKVAKTKAEKQFQEELANKKLVESTRGEFSVITTCFQVDVLTISV